MKVVTWNVEWAAPRSARWEQIARVIASHVPDIVVLTEAYEESFDEGFTVSAEPNYGYAHDGRRRKVLLWSRAEWHQVSISLDGAPPGRFASGVTETSSEPVRVLGVCVPWREAHGRSGRRNAMRWSEHRSYLDALTAHTRAATRRTLIVGDFNQTILPTGVPMMWQIECLPSWQVGRSPAQLRPIGRAG